MGSVSDVIVEGGVLNEVWIPALELVLVDVEHVGIQTRNNDDRADMRIRTRLKRNRKKRKIQPRRPFARVFSGGLFARFGTTLFHEPLAAFYPIGITRDVAHNRPYPTSSTSTLCGMMPAS